ncbi:MAG: helix-hairpin-helix domain-containing protein [Actinomycetota bacterium]
MRPNDLGDDTAAIDRTPSIPDLHEARRRSLDLLTRRVNSSTGGRTPDGRSTGGVGGVAVGSGSAGSDSHPTTDSRRLLSSARAVLARAAVRRALWVGLVVAVVLSAPLWWQLRRPRAAEETLPRAAVTNPTTAPAAPVESDSAGTGTGASPGVPAAPNGELVVHVVGAVIRPGVLRLPTGARVVDAVDAAGGLAPYADTARVNLAAPIGDGQRIVVPVFGEEPPTEVAASPPPPATGGNTPSAGGTPVDLNTATEAQLDELPGVGPSTAAAIVAHRSTVGRFGSVEELLDVRGIGPAKLEGLRDLVRAG